MSSELADMPVGAAGCVIHTNEVCTRYCCGLCYSLVSAEAIMCQPFHIHGGQPMHRLLHSPLLLLERAYVLPDILCFASYSFCKKKPVARVSAFPLAWNWSLHMYVLEVKERTFSLDRSRSTSTSAGIAIAVGICGTHHNE